LDSAKINIIALAKELQNLSGPSTESVPDPQVSNDQQEENEQASLQSRFEAAKNRVEPRFNEARQAFPEKNEALIKLWNFADGQAIDGNLKSAIAAMEKLDGAVAKLLLEAATQASNRESTLAPSKLETALGQWTEARAQVIDGLKQLEGEILAMNDPDGDDAIILVRAIQTNLTVKPDTPNAVVELQRYIETDQIITDAEGPNGFGITITIRDVLAPVLETLRAAMTA
jgi:hypothetical protein